jgi:hypothetical protein
MSDATHQQLPIAAAKPRQQPWSARMMAALSRFSPRLAHADLLVTLAIFSGVGLLASLLLLILDHQLNGQLPNL